MTFRQRLPRTHVPGREPVWPPLVPHHSRAAGAGGAQAVPPSTPPAPPGQLRLSRPLSPCAHSAGLPSAFTHAGATTGGVTEPAATLSLWAAGESVRTEETSDQSRSRSTCQNPTPTQELHRPGPDAGPSPSLSTSKPLYQLNVPWDPSCVHTTGQVPHGTWALSIPRNRRPPAGAQACLLRARQKLPLPLGAECCSAGWLRAVSLGRPGGATRPERLGAEACPSSRFPLTAGALGAAGCPPPNPSELGRTR